jgi:hypothetical protein
MVRKAILKVFFIVSTLTVKTWRATGRENVKEEDWKVLFQTSAKIDVSIVQDWRNIHTAWAQPLSFFVGDRSVGSERILARNPLPLWGRKCGRNDWARSIVVKLWEGHDTVASRFWPRNILTATQHGATGGGW